MNEEQIPKGGEGSYWQGEGFPQYWVVGVLMFEIQLHAYPYGE